MGSSGHKRSFQFLAPILAAIVFFLSVGAHANEKTEFNDAEKLYSAGTFDDLIKKLDTFERDHPQSKLTPQAENLYGLAYLRTNRPLQAIYHFQKSIDLNSPDKAFAQYMAYNLATAQVRANQPNDAKKTLGKIDFSSLDKETQIKVHYLEATLDLKSGLDADAIRESLLASRIIIANPQLNASQDMFSTIVQQAVQKIDNITILNGLLNDFKDCPLTNLITLRLSALQSVKSDQIVNSAAVGVLLPMNGKFSAFAKRTLRGIELAFHIFNLEDPDTKVTLHIEDSGEKPEQAIAAMDRLVSQDHVVAIIGPLLSKGVERLSQHAEELKVPLISLSRHIGAKSPFVFQAGLTLKLQAEQIANYAIKIMGLHKFAILYPDSKMGQESSLSFWDAVDSLGGEIVGVESYMPDETDFRKSVDKLSGLYYTEARQKDLDDLAKQREENHIRKRTPRTDKYYHLRPIVDYDAVFIPADPKVASEIIPTFAYREVNNVRFLGVAAWNTPELVERAQDYAENALFTEAFSSQPPPSGEGIGRQFLDKYKSTYGAEPTEIDALGYDAANLLEYVLSMSNASSRSDIRDKLAAIKNFQGVTGNITYTNGDFTRTLKMLTIHGGKILPVGNP